MRSLSKKGMTLIEVIVSIALLGIIAVSLFGIFAGSYSGIFNSGKRGKADAEANSILDKVYERSVQGKYVSALEVQTMVSSVLSMEGYSAGQFKLSPTSGGISVREGNERIRYFVGAEELRSGVSGFPLTLLVFEPDYRRSVILRTFITKGGS